VLLGALGLLGIGTEVGFLEAGRRADEQQLTNDRVADKVEAARALLAGRHWDEAVDLLRDALATPGATDLAPAERLLAEVKRSRTAGVLEAAEQAVRRRQPDRARALLRAYLADPEATDKGRAARLRANLDLATSADKAEKVLRQLPDEALAAFAADGRLPALDRFDDAGLRRLFAETLRARLAPEQRRRADLRREREERLVRIRATPAARELRSFVDAARKSRTRTTADPRLLAYLFKELNITDPAEQNKTLAELTGGPPPEAESLAKSIARERLTLKERFRSYEGFDQADRERFEQAVDQEMDGLEQQLRGPKSS
jgi:hypothetical protein